MRPTAAASGFVMFLLSVKVIHGVDDWEVTCTPTQICAVKGSTVDLHCSYTNPERKYGRETRVKETFWDVSGRESEDVRTSSQYSAGVRHSCSQNNCTLTITDLRVRDSATYKVRRGQRSSGSPGVTLTVTDLQVKVGPYSWYDLTCESSCQLGPVSYVWYRNGEEVHGQTSSSYSAYFTNKDSVSCAVKGQERFPSTSVCVFGGSCTKVTYAERNICAVKGSTVDISSSYNTYGYIRSLSWSSHEQQFPCYPRQSRIFWYKDGRVSVSDKFNGHSTLRIRDLTESDSAVYKFSMESSDPNQRHSGHPGVTLTVSALQVQVIRTASQSQPYIELKCHISCRPAAHLSFVWFIGEKSTRMKPSSTYRHYFKDEDIISCALEGHENYRSASVYAPRPPSVSVSPSAEVVEGCSVTLKCSADANPAANYTWYKENQTLHHGPEGIYHFRSISCEDRRFYYCEAENQYGQISSSSLDVDVQCSVPQIAVIGSSITALLMVLAFLCAFLWLRRKRSAKQTTEQPGSTSQMNVSSVCNDTSGAPQRKPAGQEDELCYTTIRFQKEEADHLYSNVRVTLLNAHKNQDKGNTEYATVVWRDTSSETRGDQAVTDSSALYSSVAKQRV